MAVCCTRIFRANRHMTAIDVTQHLDELEGILRDGREPLRCAEAIEIVLRWQFDEMLDDHCRLRARSLAAEFGFRYQAPQRLIGRLLRHKD